MTDKCPRLSSPILSRVFAQIRSFFCAPGMHWRTCFLQSAQTLEKRLALFPWLIFCHSDRLQAMHSVQNVYEHGACCPGTRFFVVRVSFLSSARTRHQRTLNSCRACLLCHTVYIFFLPACDTLFRHIIWTLCTLHVLLPQAYTRDIHVHLRLL